MVDDFFMSSFFMSSFFMASFFMASFLVDFFMEADSVLDVLVVIDSFLLAHEVIKPTQARTATDVIRDFFIRCG